MTRRTYETDAHNIEIAGDFEEVVKDKRKNITKSRQRQRRYKKRLTKQLLKKYA